MNDAKSSADNRDVVDNITDCCLWNKLGTCSLNCREKFYEWSNSSLVIADLTEDMTEHLRHLNVIPHNHYLIVRILERDLILNRLHQQADVENVNLKICPLHRYTFGVGWRVHNRCYHADHNVTFQQSSLIKRRRSTSMNTLRVAPFHLAEHIVGFSYGGKICNKHRKELYKEDTGTIDGFNINYMSDEDDMETNSTAQSFSIPDKAQQHQAQRILVALDQSPIKSQSKTPLLQQTPGAVRRLTAKLRKAVAAVTTTLADSIAQARLIS